MGTFGEISPGGKLGREARDEDSTGEGGPLLPDGPLDLDSGVIVVRRPEPPADRRPDADDAVAGHPDRSTDS